MLNRKMNLPSDDELLKQARRFDLPALTAIYDRYNSGLYYYALRMLGDACLAEDCVAETFNHLLKALRAGGGPSDQLKGYLFRSVHNWATDHYRRQPQLPLDPENDLPDSGQNPGLQAEQNIECAMVRKALAMLTPDQSYVITMHFLEGWELTEIARSLNKPVGAVKSLQHRALATLQKLLLTESEQVYELVQ